MHPLLIPYSFLAVMVLISTGRTASKRSGFWLFAWLAVATMLWGIMFRDIRGDTARYYDTFLIIRELSFSEMLSYADGQILFSSLNWLVGQFGTDARLLTISIVIVFLCLFLYGLRQVLSSYERSQLLFIYSAYPFFVAYMASGLKQGMAMASLLVGFVFIFQRRRTGWLWIASAPFWHSAAWLAVPFLILHLALYNRYVGFQMGMRLILLLLLGAIALSITGFNENLMSPIPSLIALDTRYDIYFKDASDLGYRAGFRPDFTLFSLVPVLSYFFLTRSGYPLTARVSGWWLSLYMSLSIIYQLFAFAPFADRFAGFAWFIMPLVLFIQCREAQSRQISMLLVSASVVANVLLLQFYTGSWIELT